MWLVIVAIVTRYFYIRGTIALRIIALSRHVCGAIVLRMCAYCFIDVPLLEIKSKNYASNEHQNGSKSISFFLSNISNFHSDISFFHLDISFSPQTFHPNILEEYTKRHRASYKTYAMASLFRK